MSTILKALKRLEAARESTDPNDASTLPGFSPRNSLNRRTRLAWLRHNLLKWGLAGVLLCLIVIPLWVLYGHGRIPPADPAKPGSSQSQRDVIQRQSPADVPLPAARVSPAISSVSGRDPAPARGAVRTPIRPMTAPAEERLTAPANQQAVRPLHPVRSPLPIKPRVSTKPVPEPANHTASVPPQANGAGSDGGSGHPGSPPEEDTRDPLSGAERLTDGRLKVQAIVWAANPGERMAVINNRIVHEGSVVDGFTVVHIGPENIYAREGGRLWRVPFGLR